MKRPVELLGMRCLAELAALARARYPNDKYFAGLEESVRLSSLARNQAWAYERALATLDAESWEVLRDKALAHFTDHRKGQWKQGFFNQLNDAFAYALLRRRGHRGVKVLRETGKTTPDIQYSGHRHCEVKTLCISDAAIERRDSGNAYNTGAVYRELTPQFIAKLVSVLDAAARQIRAAGDGGLIFVNIHFDDITLQFWPRYRRQIAATLEAHSAPNIYVKIGTAGRKFVAKGSFRGASSSSGRRRASVTTG
jgi:hypothetical protein